MKKIFICMVILIVMSIGVTATIVTMDNSVETKQDEVSQLEFVVRLVLAGATDIDVIEDSVTYTTKNGWNITAFNGFYEYALTDLKEQ